MHKKMITQFEKDFGFDEQWHLKSTDYFRFFQSDFIRKSCKEAGFSQKTTSVFLESISIWNDLPALKRLWCKCHHFLFISDHDDATKRQAIADWPDIPQYLHPHALMFYAQLFLSGFDYLKNRNAKRGIPLSITLKAFRDMELWIRGCHDELGVWGLINKTWIANHFFQIFFQLGRLQFRKEVFNLDYHAFRHKKNKTVLIFAGDKMVFRQDGQFNGTNGIKDPVPWESVFVKNDTEIKGNVFSPYGKALSKPVILKRNEWELIFEKGYKMLGVHVPADGRMSYDACGNSFRQALEFFPKYYPELQLNAFNCIAWFLDNQFSELLDEKSNIYQFQKEVYLYPIQGATDKYIFNRVFGRHYTKKTIDQAPQDTSLRRLIIDHVKKNNHWHTGGCLLFTEDFNWGAEVYRKSNSIFTN